MKVFYSSAHQKHNPPFEILDGGERTRSFEIPARADKVVHTLEGLPWVELLSPENFGSDPIRGVHDALYVEFVQQAFDLWSREDANYEHIALTPATFPPAGWRRLPESILGKAGFYMMDLSAPIGPGTYEAALDAVGCALSGAHALLGGDKSAFAACRPPGHHAGRSNCGGYCYFNNASIAANELSRHNKVAVLDIDYHAGNGTQDIFYNRDDVFTISIHADPAYEYPYYAGYADETGSGEGAGYHRNFPLPLGIGDKEYLSVLGDALDLVDEFKPGFLVVSAGMDISQHDPLGKFKISDAAIKNIGSMIEREDTPTLLIMEGGYNIDHIGSSFVALLDPFQ